MACPAYLKVTVWNENRTTHSGLGTRPMAVRPLLFNELHTRGAVPVAMVVTMAMVVYKHIAGIQAHSLNVAIWNKVFRGWVLFNLRWDISIPSNLSKMHM